METSRSLVRQAFWLNRTAWLTGLARLTSPRGAEDGSGNALLGGPPPPPLRGAGRCLGLRAPRPCAAACQAAVHAFCRGLWHRVSDAARRRLGPVTRTPPASGPSRHAPDSVCCRMRTASHAFPARAAGPGAPPEPAAGDSANDGKPWHARTSAVGNARAFVQGGSSCGSCDGNSRLRQVYPAPDRRGWPDPARRSSDLRRQSLPSEGRGASPSLLSKPVRA
jgi:hypothetical protein